jgi:hypothetical protein
MDNRECEICHKEYKPVKGNQKHCPVCKGRPQPKREVTVHKCVVCGKEFKSAIYNRLYCSAACRVKKAHGGEPIYTKTCTICGETYTTTKKSRAYCGKECAKKGKVIKDMEWRKRI